MSVELNTELRALVRRVEEEMNGEQMGEPTANAQQAFSELAAAILSSRVGVFTGATCYPCGRSILTTDSYDVSPSGKIVPHACGPQIAAVSDPGAAEALPSPARIRNLRRNWMDAIDELNAGGLSEETRLTKALEHAEREFDAAISRLHEAALRAPQQQDGGAATTATLASKAPELLKPLIDSYANACWKSGVARVGMEGGYVLDKDEAIKATKATRKDLDEAIAYLAERRSTSTQRAPEVTDELREALLWAAAAAREDAEHYRNLPKDQWANYAARETMIAGRGRQAKLLEQFAAKSPSVASENAGAPDQDSDRERLRAARRTMQCVWEELVGTDYSGDNPDKRELRERIDTAVETLSEGVRSIPDYDRRVETTGRGPSDG